MQLPCGIGKAERPANLYCRSTTIMGVTIFFAAFLMAMVLLVDIFYCLIDPRIKFDA